MGSGEKFALQNRLGELIVKGQIRKNYVTVMFLLCFILCLRAISTHNPRGLIFGGAIQQRVLLRHESLGLIQGAYFRNFTVFQKFCCTGINTLTSHP